MSVKANIDGEIWEFSTVAEAAEFKRSISGHQVAQQQAPPRGRRRSRPPRQGKPAKRLPVIITTTTTARAHGLSEGSRHILDVVRKTPSGLQSEDFARAIGSPSPTAVPVRMMVLGKELKALGMKPEDVVQRSRIYVKGRARSVFRPGPRLEDVLRHNGDLFTAR